MSINSPNVAASFAQRLAVTLGQAIQTISGEPGDLIQKVVDGRVTLVSTAPVAEGQLIIKLNGSGTGSTATIYVAVYPPGEVNLVWKRTSVVQLVDRYTRRPAPNMLS